MRKPQIQTAIDIGTSKIVVLVGIKKEEKGSIEIVGVGEGLSLGMRSGTVANIEEVTSSLSSAIEAAERMAGFSISSASVALGGAHISSISSRGVIAIPKEKTEITEDDKKRVIEASKTISLPSNTEIVHIIPKHFIVDGQGGVRDPLGMSGTRLEVESLIVYASSPAILNFSKCLFQAGVDVEGFITTPLAAAKGVVSERQEELGVAVCDIGARCTSVAIFEEGSLLSAVVLPIGANHITNDIAIGLRTSVEVAERVKIEYGTAIAEEIRDREKINLSKIDSKEEGEVSKKYIAEIIEARLSEIFSMIRKEIKKVKKDKLLPAGIILTGGGAKLPGIVEFAKKELELPAQIGFPKPLRGVVDKVDDPSYCVSVGTLLWGFEESKMWGVKFPPFISSFRNWLKSFLP